MIIYFNIKHLFLLCTVLFFNITDGMDLQSTIPSPSLLGLPDLIDTGLVHISIQRPPSPQRGDSKWADVELVNDCIIASLDLNPDANLLDKLIRSDETLSTAENISSLTNGPLTTHETPINLAVSDQSLELNIDAQDHLTQTAISSDAEITYTAHREAPEVNFSDLTAYDQRHVIDHGVASAPQDTYYSNAHKNHLNGSRQLNRVEQIERLECLISSSSDPKSLATQIDISLGRVGLSPKIFRDDIQTQYRAFLFDSANHFKPINTIGRQQQALEIVYPAIKAYFGRDQKGLVEFLEKHAMQGTPGFQKLLDLETGKASYGDHLSNFGKNCSSSMASLNIFHSPPTIEGIKKSNFIEDFSKLVSLVKAKQLPEAKALLDQFRAKIFTTPLAQRQAKIEEYNCLCKQYDALLEKCFNSYRNDPQYQRCLGPLTRGTMQKVEALKLLEARDYAFKSIAYKMGFEPHNLSNYDKSLIYKTIDSKIKDTYGLKDLYEHKDLLNDKDLANLKEKLECFVPPARANSESTAASLIEEIELIERPLDTSHQPVPIKDHSVYLSEDTVADDNKPHTHSNPNNQTGASELSQNSTPDKNKTITPEDLIKDLPKGKKTRGRSEIYENKGGFEETIKDFEKFNPSDLKEKPGLKTGKLPDGRHITARNQSEDGRPTLEFFDPKTDRKIKIRYNS